MTTKVTAFAVLIHQEASQQPTAIAVPQSLHFMDCQVYAGAHVARSRPQRTTQLCSDAVRSTAKAFTHFILAAIPILGIVT